MSGYAVLVVIFLLVGIALAAPTLPWPMAFDDLVLLRPFTTGQILSSFRGQWDPERLMNWGFRPGTLLFNHIRYSVFGENVTGHRLLLLFLYAVYGALLVFLASRIGMPRFVATVSVIVSMCTVYSVFHYVWLTDGVHLIQGLSFVIAAHLLVSGLDSGSKVRTSLSVLALLGGLITREDTFAAVPALVILGYVTAKRTGRSLTPYYAYVAGVAVLCAALYQYRKWVVPRAQPLGHDVVGVIRAAWKALNPMGLAGFDGWSHALITIWWVILLAAVIVSLRFRRRVCWQPAGMWLSCASFACSPGLNLGRDNLLFFPVSFGALALGALLWELYSVGCLGKTVAILALFTATVGGSYTSQVFAENFHPRSLRVIWWNGRYVYGAYARKAVIPRGRLEAVMKQLASAGIRDEWLHLNRTPKLVHRAIAEARRRPGTEGRFFYPLLVWEED